MSALPLASSFLLKYCYQKKKKNLLRILLTRGLEEPDNGCFRKSVRLLVGRGADSANVDILGDSL